jgi:hypothetical protein
VTDAGGERVDKEDRDVLRLTHATGMSRRLVGEATGIGKTAVGEYVRRGLPSPLMAVSRAIFAAVFRRDISTAAIAARAER